MTSLIKQEAISVSSIDISNDKIDFVFVDEKKYVIIKSLCENIGINYKNAYISIDNDEFLSLSSCVCKTTMTKYRGKDVKCLPIEHILPLLFKLEGGRVNPEGRKKLKIYKEGFGKFISKFVFDKVSIYNNNTNRRYEIRNRRKEINKHINTLLLESKQLDTELKLIAMGEFRELELWNDNDAKEYMLESKKHERLFIQSGFNIE